MGAAMVAGGALAAIGCATAATGAWSLVAERRRTSVTTYLGELDHDGTAAAGGRAGPPPTLFDQRLARPLVERTLAPALARMVAMVSAVTPAEYRARVRARLAAAGLDLRRRPEELIALQVGGLVVGALFAAVLLWSGALSAGVGLAAAAVLVVAGALAPMLWLRRQVDHRIASIRRDLPDVLDLLAISVEAGVGLEGALQVVTERNDTPLGDEVARTLQEMGLGLSRRDALTNLKQRSQVPELSSFVGALIQADGLGMPLGRVLKIQATEMRSKRRQWARERAAKLPVKILFPLVMCIFPAVLVVVVGPAMSQIGEALR